MKPDFMLVADASPEIGMGHAVRMYALAQRLVELGQTVVFATRTPEYIAQRLRLPCPVAWFNETNVFSCHTAVVDVYEQPAKAAARIDTARGIVVVDDYGDAVFQWADAVVNMHYGAEAHDYGVPTFAGPQWACLRNPAEINWFWPSGNRSNMVHPDCPPAMVAHIPAADRYWISWSDTSRVVPLRAFVPASMIALECIAAGIPVDVYAPTPRHERIAEAMRNRKHGLDHGGAERLARELVKL